jgi:hypothetical protein
MQVKLGDNARITAMVKATVADIKPGSFIGVTALPQPDGSQKAIGLHIFIDAQRGVVPARFMPWDREPALVSRLMAALLAPLGQFAHGSTPLRFPRVRCFGR